MTDRVTAISAELTPIVESLGLSVYDVTLTGGDRPTLTVLLDRAGETGASTSTSSRPRRARSPPPSTRWTRSTAATCSRSRAPVSSVRCAPRSTSPARSARSSPAKARDADGHVDRLRGVLAAADADSITITTDAGDHTVALDAVDAARTVFEWGPAPKPGKGSRPGRKKEVAAK